VCCAFTFCWWANTDLLLEQDAPLAVVLEGEVASTSASMVERGIKEDRRPPSSSVLATGTKKGEDVAGALRNAHAILEGVLREAPAQGAAKAA
jgi:hypothetical protein